MGHEGDLHNTLEASSVKLLHIPAENSLEKYETADKAVQEWLLRAVGVFEQEGLAFPVLFHCRSGKDRTGVVVAALLTILGVPESLVIREYLLSDGTEEKQIRKSLAGFRKLGGVAAYFSGLDLDAVRTRLRGSDSTAEIQWLQQEVGLMCRLARDFAKPPADEVEATYWQQEVAQAAAELARRSALGEAAAALYYEGWALARLQRPTEAHEALSTGLALARLGDSKPQVHRMLERELGALPEPELELQVVELTRAADAPGDPHADLLLLKLSEGSWQALHCPTAFAWLRCGELGASATPKAQHLRALEALGLSTRVSSEALGGPKPPVEHWEGVVAQIAKALSSGGCLVHCSDGFGATGVALACFLVLHGLDEPVRAKAGQPRMTAGEAIEVLRALRPGALATPQDEEEVHAFAQAAWGKHVEKVQRAFTSSASAARPAAAEAKAAPASARVVQQPGDGNCLFHSMAYGLGQVTAAALRAEICTFMERNADLSIAGTTLAEWIQMLAGSAVAEYAKKMARSAQWGGAPEIAACAHMRKVNIHVYERRGKGFELTVPFDVGGSRTVTVLYVGGVHYDALVL